jgi:hypothetical protein
LSAGKEIWVAIKARDEASGAIRAIARDISQLGMAAIGIAHLGQQFGFLNKETANTIALFGSVFTVAGTMMRTVEALSHITKVATVIDWLHNASLAMKVSLLTLGVGLVASLAGYMAYLAVATNNATDANNRFNSSLSSSARSVTRDESGDMLRRGNETP